MSPSSESDDEKPIARRGIKRIIIESNGEEDYTPRKRRRVLHNAERDDLLNKHCRSKPRNISEIRRGDIFVDIYGLVLKIHDTQTADNASIKQRITIGDPTRYKVDVVIYGNFDELSLYDDLLFKRAKIFRSSDGGRFYLKIQEGISSIIHLPYEDYHGEQLRRLKEPDEDEFKYVLPLEDSEEEEDEDEEYELHDNPLIDDASFVVSEDVSDGLADDDDGEE
jgi:hypothetical protein